ncbi:TNF receptor-associated factor 3-like [Clytia hemisphaerica]|uniref:MATH domain-containing protein n=1 Tax=Clytia hemisphaerica TaxID=252671 RepID=A0A7M5X3I9_9CNID|eukprot:TCONS_00071815-protein
MMRSGSSNSNNVQQNSTTSSQHHHLQQHQQQHQQRKEHGNPSQQTIQLLKKQNAQMRQQISEQDQRELTLMETIRQLQATVENQNKRFEEFRSDVMEEFKSLKEQFSKVTLIEGASCPPSNPSRAPSPAPSESKQEADEDECMSPPTSPQPQENAESANNTVAVSKRNLFSLIKENRKYIDQLDLRLQLQDNTYYNGRILWRIEHFKSRRRQVLNGSINALHSAPSYTKSQEGYKFCLRMYPNGDGAGLGTHLSVFLVIMKSEYDNLLVWPFNHSVKFTLINQLNRSKDLIEKMAPEKSSASFQKPTKEMNVASGCPMFAHQACLEQDGYLVDDTLFLEVCVEQG